MSKLRETFVDELADVYDAEKQLLKALPKVAKAAEHEQLRQAIEEHLEETQEHVQRMERIFEMFDETARGKPCKAMQGLLAEGEELIEEEEGDAALICAAQKVEHYEIASYGCLATWARIMGEEEAANLLVETLEEERATDEKLTELAEDTINPEEEEEEGEEEQAETGSSKSKSKSG